MSEPKTIGEWVMRTWGMWELDAGIKALLDTPLRDFAQALEPYLAKALAADDTPTPIPPDDWQVGDVVKVHGRQQHWRIVALRERGYRWAWLEHLSSKGWCITAGMAELSHISRPPLEPGTVVRNRNLPPRTGVVFARVAGTDAEAYTISGYALPWVRSDLTVIKLPNGD